LPKKYKIKLQIWITPFNWASMQNNLGSAYQDRGGTEYLDRAIECYQQAQQKLRNLTGKQLQEEYLEQLKSNLQDKRSKLILLN
jgi:hypothetical protein